MSKRFLYISKLVPVFLALFFLLGYQPTLNFPPIKTSFVLAEGNLQKTEIISGVMPMIQLPHPGYLSTRFSTYHPGVDIATGLGMPIHPIADGRVEETNHGFFGYGNNVVVSHINGLKSLYGHMDRIYVKTGQEVKSGDSLGTVGLTGRTSGPHTHLEITKDSKYIDPLTILPSLQDYPSKEYWKPYGGK